jgi:hypothetical protein
VHSGKGINYKELENEVVKKIQTGTKVRTLCIPGCKVVSECEVAILNTWNVILFLCV